MQPDSPIAGTLSLTDAAHEWSAVVIGAGPAGAAAAIELGRAGMDVLLIEKKSMPRSKVCGGCVNLSAFESLRQLGLADALRDVGAEPLQRFRLFARGRNATLDMPGGFSVTRESMDALLAREAIRSGAQFLPETTATLSRCDTDVRYLTLSSGGTTVDVSAQVVVVAAGLTGQQLCSADVAVEQSRGSRVGLGVVCHQAPEVVDQGSICMAVARDGYVGLARAENGRLSIAAAVDPKLASAEGQAGACQRILDESGIDLALHELDGQWHGTVQLTRRPVAPASNRLLCIGDSAGYVEPFTGEGMSWALRGGRLVRPVVEQGVQQWNSQVEARWCATYQQHVRQRQKMCRWIARALRHPWLVSQAVTVCRHAPWVMAPVVKRISGEPAA